MRGQDAARHGLPLPGDENTSPLSAARREEHGAENSGRPQAEPARAVEARVLSLEVRELLAQKRREVTFSLALLEILPPGALNSDEELEAALSDPRIESLWWTFDQAQRQTGNA